MNKNRFVHMNPVSRAIGEKGIINLQKVFVVVQYAVHVSSSIH